MSIGTTLFTLFNGRLVGQDDQGNRYYEEKKARPGMRQRRWVLYAGEVEASRVPSEWHAWLHYTTEAPLPETRRAWQKPHLPNLTGTAQAFKPGTVTATGDYEAWTPGA